METRQVSESAAQAALLSTPSSSSDIALVPYTQIDGAWTLGDALILRIGELADADGLLETVFVDGSVRNPREFLAMMQSPANVPVVAFAGARPIGVAWLNGCAGTHAFGHFLFLKGGRGELAREAGKLILAYWFGFGGAEPIFDVILGLVPSWNARAVKYAQGIGLTRLGEVPKIINGEAGTLLYVTR